VKVDSLPKIFPAQQNRLKKKKENEPGKLKKKFQYELSTIPVM